MNMVGKKIALLDFNMHYTKMCCKQTMGIHGRSKSQLIPLPRLLETTRPRSESLRWLQRFNRRWTQRPAATSATVAKPSKIQPTNSKTMVCP